jgi:hypothetical protein
MALYGFSNGYKYTSRYLAKVAGSQLVSSGYYMRMHSRPEYRLISRHKATGQTPVWGI